MKELYSDLYEDPRLDPDQISEKLKQQSKVKNPFQRQRESVCEWERERKKGKEIEKKCACDKDKVIMWESERDKLL